jgi:hypothetical protein
MRSGFYKLRSHLRMLTPPYLNGIAIKSQDEMMRVSLSDTESDTNLGVWCVTFIENWVYPN